MVHLPQGLVIVGSSGVRGGGEESVTGAEKGPFRVKSSARDPIYGNKVSFQQNE